jgi:Flp pilus assembly pilin Flp
MSVKKSLKNNKGQGLIEYLIIVAIVAVGSIAVMKVVGANVSAQFGNIARALGGTESTKIAAKKVTDNMVKKKDLGNFFEGAVNKSDNSKDE